MASIFRGKRPSLSTIHTSILPIEIQLVCVFWLQVSNVQQLLMFCEWSLKDRHRHIFHSYFSSHNQNIWSSVLSHVYTNHLVVDIAEIMYTEYWWLLGLSKQNKQITNKQSNKQQTKQNNNVMTTTWFYSQQRTRTIW
jgi:hypothetical protein